MIRLNPDLKRRARRAPLPFAMSEAERIAVNLFWRDGARASVLAKAFGYSKNTIYYWCLTGDAESYPLNRAAEINDIIERMGEKKAWAKYVTMAMVEKVDAANAETIASHDAG
jgi:hypothetical protein